MKILIVDDDKGTRISLRSMLEKKGFEALEAQNGPEAIEIFQKEKGIKIVLLDWILPGMTGPEVCRVMKTQRKSVEPIAENSFLPYIIILTIKDEAKDVAEGLLAGGDDYVRKPYDPLELAARIEVGKRLIDLGRQKEEYDKLAGALMMAGTVSHEFNQPIQVLAGYMELLLNSSKLDTENREMLLIMNAAVEKIKTLSKKIMSATEYRTRDYISRGPKIFDLNPGTLKSDL